MTEEQIAQTEKLVDCWEDENIVYLDFIPVTIKIPKEDWDEVKAQLQAL